MSLIHFNRVTKIYENKIPAVTDVEFKIDEGEFVFLIGPSGSGKTTIIKMIIRDEVPTTGKIYFKDRDITRLGRRRVYRLRREIGVIFQDFKLIQDKTAYENVAFAMEVAGKKGKEIKETVPYLLDIVGLSNRMNAFPKQLSGGEQQRVAIARALSNNPKILIADEPTGNLDPASAWDIVQVLNKVNNWGTTVLMSTHGTDIVNSLNKRVIQMESGRIIRDDNKGKYEIVQKFEENLLKVSEDYALEEPKDDKYNIDTDDKKVFARKHFVLNLNGKKNIEKRNILSKLFSFFRKKTNESKSSQILNSNIINVIQNTDSELETKKKLHDILKEKVYDQKKDVVGLNDFHDDSRNFEILFDSLKNPIKNDKNKNKNNLRINDIDINQKQEPLNLPNNIDSNNTESNIGLLKSNKNLEEKNNNSVKKTNNLNIKSNKKLKKPVLRKNAVDRLKFDNKKDELEINQKLKQIIDDSKQTSYTDNSSGAINSNLEDQFKNISISKLNLRRSTLTKLKKLSILSLEDLVNLGVDGLKSKGFVDNDEILEISSKVEELVLKNK